VVAQYPTADHACHCPKRRSAPSLEHQAAYCLDTDYVQCPIYASTGHLPAQQPARSTRRKPRLGKRLVAFGFVALFILLVIAWMGIQLQRNWPGQEETILATAVQTPLPTTPAANVVLLPTVTPTPTGRDANQVIALAPSPVGGERFVTPTPVPDGQVLTLAPKSNQVGWWVSDSGARQIGDSFLYAGQFDQQSYVAAAQFDLGRIPRGAPIHAATLRLTGLRVEGITADTPNRWVVQFIAEDSLPALANADFLTIFTAPAAITLLPELQPTELGVDQVNQWQLDENVRRWLEQQLLDGTTSFTIRLLASANGDNALFGWDSGFGSESKGNTPSLLVSVGAPPPTPPPLPTRAVVVATLTPLPENVMTAVAQSATATAEANLYGTPTPLSVAIVTPTPLPENLATVQANALAQGLPAVVLHTPVPANAATATADAAYATAVALTTGTFTPVPTGYVTPALLFPPPPPENVATAAARVVAATEAARLGVPAPTALWNGVYAIYEYATPTPANAETAVAMIQAQNAAAVTTGTPTPTPWNLVVITKVPPPTPTEIPIIVPADQLEPTPTPTPTIPVVAQDLSQFSGLVLFMSDRSGTEEVWAMDPATGEIQFLVRDTRLHALARELMLANSPNGDERAIVDIDDQRELEIKVYSTQYNTTRQVTHFENATSYDPAWSPLGDKIAFVSTASGGDEIYVTDLEGQTIQRLTENTWEWDKHPSWSPDGSQIVFFSNRDSGRKQLWIMNADGSNQRNLSNDEFENWDPVWIR
jgi:hypothetical protein